MNLPVRLFHEVQINMSAIFNLSLLVQPLWVVFSALTRVTLASISGFRNQYIYGKGGWLAPCPTHDITHGTKTTPTRGTDLGTKWEKEMRTAEGDMKTNNRKRTAEMGLT